LRTLILKGFKLFGKNCPYDQIRQVVAKKRSLSPSFFDFFSKTTLKITLKLQTRSPLKILG